jgi:hypothetical protein
VSEENVEIVRLANEPHNGEDMVPLIRQSVEDIADLSDTDAVVAAIADDPNVRQMHPDVEWDASALGPFDVAHGLYGMAVFWGEWVEVWESYVYEVREYRDLGDWVLTVLDVRARGRGGIPVEIRAAAQLWKVRDGKIAVVRVFGSAAEALKAAGLEA